MCGIAGMMGSASRHDDVELADLTGRMTRPLAHRGPDDEGCWTDREAQVALGHRRLSVIDLTAGGHQPAVSQSGRYVLTYNGELYNYLDLRSQLERQGIVCHSASDTEVLLEAIAAWGLVPALERSNGMFAFAVWDRHERRLSLACDRLGEKPLYYGRHGASWLFASELSALRAHPHCRPEVDPDVLALYLRHTHVPAPHCILRDTWKLPPGSLLTLDAGAAELPAPRSYWSLLDVAVFGEAHPVMSGTDQALSDLDVLLRDSVRLRMQADVPYGALLSGGVDSSLVVALAQEQSSRPVQTFTIGFEDETFNEARQARAVARHLGTDHTELYVGAQDALALIPELPRLYEEPFADSSAIPSHLVARLARKSVTVCLAGDGGDELFAGYARYTHQSGPLGLLSRLSPPVRRTLADLLVRVPPRRWDAVLATVAPLRPGLLGQRRVGDKVHRLAEGLAAPDGVDSYLRLMSHWQDPASVVPGAVEPATAFTAQATATAGLSPGGRMAYLDQIAYLPGDLLTKLDRATMAVSLEARLPLLDHRIVEASWRWPVALKTRGGVSKWPLRELLARRLPTDLVHRPKAGFSIPVGDWLRGPLRDWAEELIDPVRLGAEGYLEPGTVRRAWSQHLSGARHREHEIWAVLMFQAWLDFSTSVSPPGHWSRGPRTGCAPVGP